MKRLQVRPVSLYREATPHSFCCSDAFALAHTLALTHTHARARHNAEPDNSSPRFEELQNLRTAKSELEAKITEMKQRYDEFDSVQKELSAVQARLAAVQSDGAADSAALKRERDEMKLQQLALEQKNKMMSSEIAEWQTDCTKWQNEFTRIQLELRTKTAEHQNAMTDLRRTTDEKWRNMLAPVRAMKIAFTAQREDIALGVSELRQYHQKCIKQLAEHMLMSDASHKKRYADIQEEHRLLQVHCGKLQKEQKKLLNAVIEAKGNIRVFCRVRPLKRSEEQSGGGCSRILSDREVMIKDSLFKFDSVFGPKASQQDVFTEAKPFVQACVEGYNVCMFAYGQTGSGKTYTMEGTPDNRGMNYRACEKLFDMMHERENVFNFSVKVSIVEIYMGRVLDLLLSPSQYSTQQKLDIKRGPEGMYIPGLTEIPVSDSNTIMSLLRDRAAVNRRTNATKMNQASSRSHCVLMVTVVGIRKSDGQRTRGKMIMVDLAGSERVNRSKVTGASFKEATAINVSLSALGNVISALQHKAKHVPYRDSKLTYLLQDTLGGQSKCLMFCQVSPAAADSQESVCTLKFASRVASVTLGQAKKNVSRAAAGGKETEKYKQIAIKLKEEAETARRAAKKAEQLVQKAAAERKNLEDKISSQSDQLRSKNRELAGLKENILKAEKRLKHEARKTLKANKKQASDSSRQQIKQLEAKLSRERMDLQKQVEQKATELADFKKQSDIRAARARKDLEHENEKLKAKLAEAERRLAEHSSKTVSSHRTSLRASLSKRRSSSVYASTRPATAPSTAPAASSASGSLDLKPPEVIPEAGADETSENMPIETPSRQPLRAYRSSASAVLRSRTKQRREWKSSRGSRNTPAAARMRARIQSRTHLSPSRKKRLTSSGSIETSGGENDANGANVVDPDADKQPGQKRVRFSATRETRTIEARPRTTPLSRRIRSKRGTGPAMLGSAKRISVRTRSTSRSSWLRK